MTVQVASSATMVPYAGLALLDDTTYYWLVRWWDFEFNQAPDSAVASFDIAIIDKYYWVPAVWIGAQDINVVRSEFTAPDGLVQVR